jgi:hypothetical protein
MQSVTSEARESQHARQNLVDGAESEPVIALPAPIVDHVVSTWSRVKVLVRAAFRALTARSRRGAEAGRPGGLTLRRFARSPDAPIELSKKQKARIREIDRAAARRHAAH